MSVRLIMKLEVAAVERLPAEVSLIAFRHPKRPSLPKSTAGAHVDVHLPGGRVRQYSLCGDPANDQVYRIAVKREFAGRGGSIWLHDALEPGMVIPVSAPRNHFPLAVDASHHVLIGGGIGVTPMIAMAHSLREAGSSFDLHYCARGAAPPFADTLRALCGEKLVLHGSAEHRLVPEIVLSDRPAGTHVYVCGPPGLMNAIRAATAEWPDDCVHAETFKSQFDETFVPEPFEMQLVSDGRVVEVAADESALQALRRNGIDLPSSCETGLCGSCERGYVAGEILHRDAILNASARRTRFMPCVSRGRGRIFVDC